MINPYFIFEITPRCNIDCIYCYNVWKHFPNYQSNELKAEEIIFLFQKLLSETKIDGITISGGEPLLYKDLFKVLEFLNNKNIKLGITTNAILLDEKKISKLIQFGVKYFEISLDTINPQIYRQLTNDEQLSKVKNSIQLLKKYHAKVAVSTIITKLNIISISDIIDLCFGFSIDYLMLNRFIPSGNDIKKIIELKPDISELRQVLKVANEKSGLYKLPINITVPIENCIISHDDFPNLNFGTCVCGIKKWAIDSVGNLRTCEQNPEILGNLFTENFNELKNNTKVEEFVNKTFKSNCKECERFLNCGGACRFIN